MEKLKRKKKIKMSLRNIPIYIFEDEANKVASTLI